MKERNLVSDFYSPGEVARMAGCTPRTIRNYCRDGLIVAQTASTGRWIIPRDSVIRHLSEIGRLRDMHLPGIVYRHEGMSDADMVTLMTYATGATTGRLEVIEGGKSGVLAVIRRVLTDQVDRVFIMDHEFPGYDHLAYACDGRGTGMSEIGDGGLDDEESGD